VATAEMDDMADDMDDGMADDMDDMTGEELPATGVESRLLFIIAATLLLAGLLLASLSRRSKRLTV
ncbi:MAG: LPXTG cell wall anchor domain-containing protein, partial [bacterium]|nr:LPXTG cell wall anchor domain-containing protein [bacterium]